MSKLSENSQKELIELSIDKKIHLKEILKENNYLYDDLIYYSNGAKIEAIEYLCLDDIKKKNFNIPSISFFSGAGGFDIGFSYAGFKTKAFFEYNELFCNTLRQNFKDTPVIGPPYHKGDLSCREDIFHTLKSEIDINKPFEGVFFGGPPCQPFSIASNQRYNKNGDNFKRVGFEHNKFGGLLSDYVWYITQFLPKVFVIENVPGLYELDGGLKLNEELADLRKLGYKITSPNVINVANYGVPQNRNRLFIIGARDTDETLLFPSRVKNKIPCHVVFTKSFEDVKNHQTRAHMANSVKRYAILGYGKRDKLGRVDRLNPLRPSKTVIAGGNKGGGRSHLHPFIPRTISVRESARLQTFPDDYIFTGSTARQFTQVGNAVPPLFAYKLAEQIRTQFFADYEINIEEKKNTSVFV